MMMEKAVGAVSASQFHLTHSSLIVTNMYRLLATLGLCCDGVFLTELYCSQLEYNCCEKFVIV